MKNNYKKVFDRINDGLFALDKNWNFTYVNKAALRYSRNKNFIGKNIWKEFPYLKNTMVEKCYHNALKSQKQAAFEFEEPLSKRNFLFSVYPSKDGLTVFTVDITNMKVQEDKLKQAIVEKELLLKEAHHRIKNNLQMVSSLLNFQLKKIKNKELKNVFIDTQNRINAISIIHKNLYYSSSLAFINVKKLLNDFINNLVKTLRPANKDIKIDLNIEEMVIESDLAVTISLIANELITNSFKYAFEGRKSGYIYVSLKDFNNEIYLNIKDDGKGISPGYDILKEGGIGLNIIHNLIAQNGGKYSYKGDKGTEFSIVFRKQSLTYKL